jgi:hypothetical protein
MMMMMNIWYHTSIYRTGYVHGLENHNQQQQEVQNE